MTKNSYHPSATLECVCVYAYLPPRVLPEFTVSHDVCGFYHCVGNAVLKTYLSVDSQQPFLVNIHKPQQASIQ